MSKDKVFVINCGSSSIKYQLINIETGASLASGLVERIGQNPGVISHSFNDEKFTLETEIPDHNKGLELAMEMFAKHGPELSVNSLIGVGHRVVQGGDIFDDSAVVTPKVLEQIRELSPLAPLHNPANIIGIEVAQRLFSEIPHIVVFDSAFFAKLPAEAKTYAINKEIAERFAIKRYGAHGTSHKFVGSAVLDFLKVSPEKIPNFKQIVLHLGNGASASAQIGYKAVDTSMGLTPLEGLVMGTRSGDIDPAVVFHLSRQSELSIDEIDNLLNKESGVFGLTGVSDMRDLDALCNKGDKNALVAREVYIHRLVHYVGAYAAILGGLDAITFTAGIGENDAKIRELLLKRLGIFGVEVDENANNTRNSSPHLISANDSKVQVLVVPTNEELAIALEVQRLAV